MTYVILQGNCLDVLKTIPPGIIQTCVTSPPYFGLRDYGVANQIGLEATPQAYVDQLVSVFREVRRTLRDDGTLWLNLGDSYAGSWGNQGRKETRGTQRPINGPMMQNLQPYPDKKSNTGKIPDGSGLKPKDLIGIPWMVAFALRADGWYLREDIIWQKPNAMPDPTKDRCTRAHEYIFHLSKSRDYYHDADAIREPISESQQGRVRKDAVGGKSHKERGQHSAGGVYDTTKQRNHESRRYAGFNERFASGEYKETRNRRSVWTVITKPFKEAHFATFPPDLIRPCILAGAAPGKLVLDPFGGAGTTALVSEQLGRHSISIELNPDYVTMAKARVEASRPQPMAAE